MVADTELGRQLKNVPDVNGSDGIGILRGDDLGCDTGWGTGAEAGWYWGYDGVEGKAGITLLAVP